YDEAYFEETAKIGRVHVRVGLPQMYMLTSMSVVREAFVKIVDSELDGASASHTRRSIGKVLHLELAIMLETYRDDFVARAQRAERKRRAALDRTLARTEHRYMNAVALARMLVVGMGAQARVRMFNREAELLTGFGREDVLGEPFEILLPEGFR